MSSWSDKQADLIYMFVLKKERGIKQPSIMSGCRTHLGTSLPPSFCMIVHGILIAVLTCLGNHIWVGKSEIKTEEIGWFQLVGWLYDCFSPKTDNEKMSPEFGSN